MLTLDFFTQNTLTVAQSLLGKTLVRILNGTRLSGVVVETEAYFGSTDSASHAFKGQTSRNAAMFGPPGYSYIYLIYGLHTMLNVVTEPVTQPAAILIRAIEPQEGLTTMRLNRGKQRQNLIPKNLTNGPGKLCQALAIDRHLNRWDLTQGSELWFEDAQLSPNVQIACGPRVGIGYATIVDQQAPWRFWLKNNAYVSK